MPTESQTIVPPLAERALESLEDEVATLAARIAAATGRFLELIGELERREAWASQGFLSLAHWLSFRTGMDLVTAREHVRIGRALAELPRTSAALEDGAISFSKARALTRVARPETEEALLEVAKTATAAQLGKLLGGLRRADPAADRECAQTVEDRRHLDTFFDTDGMLVVHARLAPEEGALLLRALESARRELWKEATPGVPVAAQRADALALVADRSLTPGAAGRGGGDRTMVMVHVDADVLADPQRDGQSRLEPGGSTSAEASRRLACDASIVEATHGSELQLGRRTRVVSRAMRRALQLRDGGTCRFPGCSCRIADAHHVDHWVAGGPTVLTNLLSLCRRHHVLVHEGGFRVALEGKSPRFFDPRGRLVPDLPPVLGPEKDRLGELVREQTGLGLGPRSLVASWDGTPVDYDWAASMMPS